MNWSTLYIAGRGEFKEDVAHRLENTDLNLMRGYETGATIMEHDMYWIGDGTTLRQVKEAIGSKLIWKYRLRFYDNLNDLQPAAQPEEAPFTEREKDMVRAMRSRMDRVA